jgi:spore germination protein YaaH
VSRALRRLASFLLVPLSLLPLAAIAPQVGPPVLKRIEALFGAVLAPGVAQAAAPAPACVRPAHLSFARDLGKAVGTLRWRAPRGARARVLRDGRVVGETGRQALRIRVTIGRAHRFTVVALGAGGRPTRCRTTVRVSVRSRPPGAPRALAVGGDEHGLRLSWKPGARGDDRLAGYRVLRNGAVLGQTRRTSWRLGAAANRSYRFAVVAVDRRGRRSARSNAVTVRTGHQPPGTPGGLQALTVSDAEIGVRWQPSHAAAGRIAGYRVLRDGAVVAQVAGTSLLLERLAAGTAYRISVEAVDGLGYVSKPAPAVTARTQDPVPTAGRAHAYLLASTDQSFTDFRAHYRSIGYVYPTYFDCTTGADLSGHDDLLVTRWAQARRVRVLPRINCQRTTVIHKILTDPDTRDHWLNLLTGVVNDDGYDGVSLDFEAGAATDRDALSSFVEELTARLHAMGKLLTIAVSPKAKDIPNHPRSGIFDYPRLSRAADWLFVLGWGLHWTTSAPGSPDDLSWTSTIVAYVTTMPFPRRFVYGTNLYGLDWPAGGGPANPASAYEFADLTARLPALGATTALDPASDTFHATYTDGSGVAHDVWYPDATTVDDRVRLAQAAGLGAIGFWRLGREDQRVWNDPLVAPGASW